MGVCIAPEQPALQRQDGFRRPQPVAPVNTSVASRNGSSSSGRGRRPKGPPSMATAENTSDPQSAAMMDDPFLFGMVDVSNSQLFNGAPPPSNAASTPHPPQGPPPQANQSRVAGLLSSFTSPKSEKTSGKGTPVKAEVKATPQRSPLTSSAPTQSSPARRDSPGRAPSVAGSAQRTPTGSAPSFPDRGNVNHARTESEVSRSDLFYFSQSAAPSPRPMSEGRNSPVIDRSRSPSAPRGFTTVIESPLMELLRGPEATPSGSLVLDSRDSGRRARGGPRATTTSSLRTSSVLSGTGTLQSVGSLRSTDGEDPGAPTSMFKVRIPDHTRTASADTASLTGSRRGLPVINPDGLGAPIQRRKAPVFPQSAEEIGTPTDLVGPLSPVSPERKPSRGTSASTSPSGRALVALEDKRPVTAAPQPAHHVANPFPNVAPQEHPHTYRVGRRGFKHGGHGHTAAPSRRVAPLYPTGQPPSSTESEEKVEFDVPEAIDLDHSAENLPAIAPPPPPPTTPLNGMRPRSSKRLRRSVQFV